MLTYNHEPYLKDALNSILHQRTDFGFEILVHDDASQDGSQEIIKDYAIKYPKIIKPILQKENQHSKKIYPSVYFNYPRANLPFMAMCEGDDYWTDPDKLQKQIDGLIANPGVNLSFHSAYFIDYSSTINHPRIFGDYEMVDAVIPFTKILHRVRGWIPTASCVIRREAKEQFLSFLRDGVSYLTVGDIYLQFFGALNGGALFFNKPMSAYRYRTEHSWTKKLHRDPAFKATHEIAMIRSYRYLNKLTNNVYRNDFVILTLQRLLWLFNPGTPPKHLNGISYLEKIYKLCEKEIENTLALLKKNNKRYVIFGCGSGCLRIIKALPSDRVAAIIDRDQLRVGETIEGKPIIRASDFDTYADCEIIVSTIFFEHEDMKGIGISIDSIHRKTHYLFKSAISLVDSTQIPENIFIEKIKNI